MAYNFQVVCSFRKLLRGGCGIVWLAAIQFAAVATVKGEERVERSVGTILELAEKLKESGKDLCIVRMPVRTEIYQKRADEYHEALAVPHENTVAGDYAEKVLRKAGVAVVNLYPDIHRESLQSDIFKPDRFHFTPRAEKRLSEILMKKLRDAQVMSLPDEKKNVVFMGECFAESFAKEIIASDPWDEIKILNKNGGGNMVHNYLYVFPEEYLEATDLVVWVFTDRHFSNANFAELESDPKVPANSEPRVVLARVKSTTAMKLGDEKLVNYPDALRTGLFELVGSKDQLVGIDQILKARQVTINRKYGEGDLLRLKLIPWRAWIRDNPKMVSMYLIDDVNDFTLPQFWIEDWLIEGEEDEIHLKNGDQPIVDGATGERARSVSTIE